MPDKLSVLLVEDNPGDARLIRELLVTAGASRFRLQIADHLAAGLAHLATGGFDVVLLDLTLPDSRGFVTLTKMQTEFPTLPIIVLTGLDDAALAEQAVREGAQDYLIKGQLQGDLLTRAIRYAIERKRAEEVLRQSEARLRAILDATPFPIALVDMQDNNIDFWSRSALTLFGHTAPTATEWHQIAYPDPDYRREMIERWQPAVEKAQLSAQTVNAGEYQVTCRDGSVRICELFVAFLADRLVVTFDDITERKRAEEELSRERILLRTVIDNLPDAVYAKDLQGRKVLTNRADLTGIGKPEAEVLGRTDAELFPAYVAARFVDDDQTVLHAGQPLLNHEELLVNHEGRQIWLLTSKLPLRDTAGEIIGLVGIGRDITESKRAAEALQESEARFRVIFESASDAIHVDSAEDEILQVNTRMCEMMGYSREELLGMRVSDLQAPEIRGEPGSVVENELARHGHAAFESLGLHRSGRRIPMEVGVSRLEGAQGDLYISIVRDITERKRAEAQLNAQLDELHRWHAVTLGRETRILDLKREVNELLTQAGQPPRYASTDAETYQVSRLTDSAMH